MRDVWDDLDLEPLSKIASFRKFQFPAILQDALEELESLRANEKLQVVVSLNQALDRILRIALQLRIQPQIEQAISCLASALKIANVLPSGNCELCTAFISQISGIFEMILKDGRQSKVWP